MFSAAQPKNRPAVPKSNSAIQAQRGFAVRVFKGPTLSSFPYTATAKFDAGYRPTVNDPRQAAQNWYGARPEPSRAPSSNTREPPKPSRFGSWTENRNSRDNTNRGSAGTTYADFIYERSLSSKSDIYSENDTASNTTFTPSSTFSPALTPESTITSAPSHAPFQSPTSSSSTATPSSPRHPFPLHIPALAQAQSAIRGFFVHPNGNAVHSNGTPSVMPPAPASRSAALPDIASPPRFLPPDAPARPTSPLHVPSCVPQHPAFNTAADYFPPPPSESEVGEAQRLAQRNAQYNAAQSALYQAPPRSDDSRQARDTGRYNGSAGAQAQSPDRIAMMGTTARSVASSSFPTVSSDQGRGVYESSSIVTSLSTFATAAPTPALRPFPSTAPPRVAFVSSEASSVTVVDSDGRWRESHVLDARPAPAPQLVEVDLPVDRERERVARQRVMSDVGRYEELRGLNILSERPREAYVQRPSPSVRAEIPSVVRSDSSGGSGGSLAQERQRERRTSSGNLHSSLQLPARPAPSLYPPRPSSTPPLPRIDTSRATMQPLPSDPRLIPSNSGVQQQSPPRREPFPSEQPSPMTAPPGNASRSRTPVAGPRTLQEPQRRRSDGDQPMNGSPSLLKRTSAIFHKAQVAESLPRPRRPGALPLEPQRRRSDGFQSVVPPRPPAAALSAPRNVRWNETLVCPSPIFASQRRKGWYNRRGDQLWTNDGAYKPAPPGEEFPPELRDYPAHGSGWMNEDGVRIDTGHRLIPKAPLRSALKQTQARGPVIQVENGN